MSKLIIKILLNFQINTPHNFHLRYMHASQTEKVAYSKLGADNFLFSYLISVKECLKHQRC